MTVSNTDIARDSYPGNDSVTAFVHNFRILASSEVLVTLVNDATGLETVQVETTNYSVSGVGSATGTVTFVTAPAIGETVVLTRNLNATQGVNLVSTGQFPSENVEKALDRLTMLIQQALEVQQRTIRLPVGSALTNVELPAPEANKAIAWNSTATALINTAVDAAAIESAKTAAETAANNAATSETNAANSANSAAASASSAATYGVAAPLYLANNYI